MAADSSAFAELVIEEGHGSYWVQNCRCNEAGVVKKEEHKKRKVAKEGAGKSLFWRRGKLSVQ